MRKYIRVALFIVVALMANVQVYASHIFGGELLYNYIAGNTYRLTLTLYGDCSASSSVLSSLYTAKPKVTIYRNTTQVDTVRLQPDAVTGTEVSPVCPSQLNKTKCNGGTLPGVRKFVYTKDISITGTNANWRFVFNGDLINSTAGRSGNITNITAPTSSNVVTLEARLNNTNGANSSPQYNTIPTPYYALNLAAEYNQGAVDPDGDSLVFNLISAVTDNGNPVNYVAPATPTTPLLTAAGSYSFNGQNGQMSFLPNVLQDALVVNQVSEYKNGVLVGTSVREMTFVVLDNLGSINNIQNTKAVDVVGGANTGGNLISTCKSDLSFHILATDIAQNNISVSYTSLPPGATIVVYNNGSAAPDLYFHWNTAAYPTGFYNFFVTYKNNACPISTSQTIAYTIRITDPYEYLSSSQEDAGCAQAIPVHVVFKGKVPATLVVMQEVDTITKAVTANDTATLTLSGGNYTGILVNDDKTCSTSFNFSVSDSTAQPCCIFSYPTAFTPNNDGRNDRFNVMISSPPSSFEISIYDRWGRRVYLGNDYKKGWDGKFKGRDCGADVFFYSVRAKCLGHVEETTGSVMLVQ